MNASPPTLGGAAGVGQTLTCDPGTWRGDASFAFAWVRDGAVVVGTGPAYPSAPRTPATRSSAS